MITLRLKITILLILVVFPIVTAIYLNYLAQRDATSAHYLRTASLTIQNGAKGLDNYLRLKNTTFHLLLHDLFLHTDTYNGFTPEFDTHVGLALKANPGFSMLLYTDAAGKITYAHMSTGNANKHLLPRDVTGHTLLSQEMLNTLNKGYEDWQDNLSYYKQQEQQLQSQANMLSAKGEKNSLQYRQIQEKLSEVEMFAMHPPLHIFIGGKQFAAAAGLPFRTDTFLFVIPETKNKLQNEGLIIGVLDWSIVEDQCFAFASDIKNEGLSKAEVTLFHPQEKRVLYNDTQWSRAIFDGFDGAMKPLTYVEREKAYLISAPFVSAETLNRSNKPSLFLEYSLSTTAEQDAHFDDAYYYLTAYVPEEDILFQSNKIRRVTLVILVISILFLVLVILLISRQIVYPIKNIAALSKSISKGDLTQRLDISQRDEVGALADTFNIMADKLQEAQRTLYAKNEELRLAKDRYKFLFDNAPVAITLTDLDGKVKEANKATSDISGYSPEEIYAINIQTLYHEDEERTRLLEQLDKFGIVKGMETPFLNKFGERLLCRCTAIRLDLDNMPLICSIVEDISYQKKIENEKAVMIDHLQKAKKMEAIGLMASGVAHDLNNILSGIVGYPELILKGLPEESMLRKPIQAIGESGLRAASVVADLLTVARGAASEKQVADLKTLIEEYLDSPEAKHTQSLYPGLSLQFTCSASTTNVLCSSVHIKKCLMNLIINAAEAVSGNGTIRIILRKETIHADDAGNKSIKPGNYVVLDVCDDGPGIPDADMEHIFEPFYTKKKMGRSGTGLGLTVVWNTVQDHDGKIFVESSAKGTHFQLYFPADNSENITRDNRAEDNPLIGCGEKILVVDDEAVLRDLACQVLDNFGYSVEAVSSGEEAIRFVQEMAVDLVILDMMMEPGINGYQTYKEILKRSPGQKAIITSGFSESVDVQGAQQLGAKVFIKKPYSMYQLGQAVKTALG